MELVLRPAPLESLAPRNSSSLVPPAVPSGVSALDSESEPVNSSSAASAASTASSSVAAAFSLAPFESIPVFSHHLLATHAPGRLTAPSHRSRIGRVAINCATVFCLQRIDVQIRTIPASFIAPARDG